MVYLLGRADWQKPLNLIYHQPAAGFVLGPISGGFLYQYYQPAAGWSAVLILLIVFAVTLRPRKDPALSQT
jgi:MFS family permease